MRFSVLFEPEAFSALGRLPGEVFEALQLVLEGIAEAATERDRRLRLPRISSEPHHMHLGDWVAVYRVDRANRLVSLSSLRVAE